MRGEMIQIPLKAGHRRPPAKRFAGMLMMAQHYMLTDFFQGIWAACAKNPICL